MFWRGLSWSSFVGEKIYNVCVTTQVSFSNSKIAVKAKISHSQNTNHFLWNMESTHAKAYHTYQTTIRGSVRSKLRRTKQNNIFPYTLFSTTTWQNVGPMKIVMGYSYVVILSSTKLNHFYKYKLLHYISGTKVVQHITVLYYTCKWILTL